MTEFVKKHFNYRDISKGLSERDCLKVIMDLSLDGSVTNNFLFSQWICEFDLLGVNFYIHTSIYFMFLFTHSLLLDTVAPFFFQINLL